MSENADANAPETVSAPSMKFGFIKFVVRDLAGITAFYERVLGLMVTRTIDLPDIVEKVMSHPNDHSGFGLILYFNKDDREVTVGDGHGPLGLYVRDVDAAYAHAVSQGATPHRAPFDAGNLRVAFVLDPDGRELEFISVNA